MRLDLSMLMKTQARGCKGQVGKRAFDADIPKDGP